MLARNNLMSVKWNKNFDKSICLKLYSALCEIDKNHIVKIFLF